MNDDPRLTIRAIGPLSSAETAETVAQIGRLLKLPLRADEQTSGVHGVHFSDVDPKDQQLAEAIADIVTRRFS